MRSVGPLKRFPSWQALSHVIVVVSIGRWRRRAVSVTQRLQKNCLQRGLRIQRSNRLPARKRRGSGNLPLDCRSVALLAKILAQGALARRYRIIISAQPLRDKSVAIRDRHIIWWKFPSALLCQRDDRPLDLRLNGFVALARWQIAFCLRIYDATGARCDCVCVRTVSHKTAHTSAVESSISEIGRSQPPIQV